MDERLLRDLLLKAADLKAEIEAQNKLVVDARRNWARSRSSSDAAQLEVAQKEAARLRTSFSALIREMEQASGYTSEELDEISTTRSEVSSFVTERAELVADKIDTSQVIEHHLANSIDLIRRLLPRDWLHQEPRVTVRLDELATPGAFLSLAKNLRRESERPGIHRLRQALYVAEDYLRDDTRYDHFAGAGLVPTIVQLGRKLETLQDLRSTHSDRIERLWRNASSMVDSTIFELLVAAECQDRGRDISFIPEGPDKSADLRAFNPYPLLIECKRQAAITTYELSEEQAVRSIFQSLLAECRRRGIVGLFNVSFSVECIKLDLNDVVDGILRATNAADGSFPWGIVTFKEIDQTSTLSGPTPIYSPRMLEELFGWNSDLPKSDGICIAIENNNDLVSTDVRGVVGLTWINTSQEALRKKTWAPVNLLSDAVKQITPGEIGVIYVSYQEGARVDIADARLEAFRERLKGWSYDGTIRIPIVFLNRLYPRVLFDGRPDLIENTIQFVSEDFGGPELVDYFPSLIFTS